MSPEAPLVDPTARKLAMTGDEVKQSDVQNQSGYQLRTKSRGVLRAA
ncbi:hypothetical protein ACE102_07535 [Bradyrhizobium sp. vgs-9]